MMSLSDDKQADVIDAFNTTSRYLDDILNINNVYFDNMVSQIYPSELQLNKANASDTEAAFLDLHLSISNDIVSTKIYDKCDDFDFEIVNFPFLDGDVPRSTSYGFYISQLIRFARATSYVADFNTRNKLLTQKLLKQGYRYHKLCKTFSKFYRRYYDLISKFQVGLKSLLCQGLSEPDFYKAVVAGPAVRRAPDHFFGRVYLTPCPFFSFRLILLLNLILFNLAKFIDPIINMSSIDRTSQGVKASENYNGT